jgi:hypothetical protein
MLKKIRQQMEILKKAFNPLSDVMTEGNDA